MRTAAFFDVDDTLITVKSIFRFLRFHLVALGRDLGEYEAARRRLRDAAAAGASRATTLGMYYHLFEGEEEVVVAAHGRRWFDHELATGNLFHDAVLRRFRGHAAAGDLTVLVSGSFPPCLEPLGDHLGAHVVLCSRPEIRAGRYTGEISVPMVGAAKAAAVLAEAAAREVNLAGSFAYGDHPSDLPVLELVGNPVTVGDDPLLATRPWPRLPL